MTATIMEEPSDGLHKNRNMKEDMAKDTHLWRGWMALGSIDPTTTTTTTTTNNNNNNNINNNTNYHMLTHSGSQHPTL